MTDVLPVLDSLPAPETFYSRFWGQRPFVIRSCVPPEKIENLVSPDELAGFSCENDAQSRLVYSPESGRSWRCEYGPFSEQELAELPPTGWGLLVRNIDQFHPQTASLLPYFNTSPRWLLDDIMVSYAPAGGSVGPHVDSYHVFLVQGMGVRQWRVASDIIAPETADKLPDLDLEILANEFSGDTVEVTCGDAIYIPPGFAHEGISKVASMTFSVGFLGPRLSELFMDYGTYLHEQELDNRPYAANNMSSDDQGFAMSAGSVAGLRDMMNNSIGNDNFTQWLCIYFSSSTAADFEDQPEFDVDHSALKERLLNGDRFRKPPHVKAISTDCPDGGICIGVGGVSFCLPDSETGIANRVLSERYTSVSRHDLNDVIFDFFVSLFLVDALEWETDYLPAEAADQ